MATFTFSRQGGVPEGYDFVDMFAYQISFAQLAYPGTFAQNYAGAADVVSFDVANGGAPDTRQLFLLGEDLSFSGGTYTGHVTAIQLLPFHLSIGPAFADVTVNYVNVDIQTIFAAIATPTASDDLALLRGLLSGSDMIVLSEKNDIGFGWSGGDAILGLGGDDTLYGDAGNDVLIGGTGADALSGGVGSDTASYETAASGVVAALDGSRLFEGDALGDLFVSIENLSGTGFADTLIGDARANFLTARGSNDTLWGRGGTDNLSGGDGHDTLFGGAGADVINLGAGFDRAGFESLNQRGDKVTGFGADDLFLFKRAAFGNLDLGVIDDAAFVNGMTNAAIDANDRFIFRTTDCTLWYDADGTGATVAVMMADLQSAYLLQSEQIFIIA